MIETTCPHCGHKCSVEEGTELWNCIACDKDFEVTELNV